MKASLTILFSGMTGLVLAATLPDQQPKTSVDQQPPTPKTVKAPPTPKLTRFMRGKLTASQSVLDGLVTEDYKKIEKGGQQMLVMSKAAGWKVLKTDTYAQYSAEFQRTTERLVRMAKKRQLDSAALSYMQVTMTCINCHKYVKKERLAHGEPVPSDFRFVGSTPHLPRGTNR